MAAIGDLANVGAGDVGIKAIHRVRGVQQQHFVAVIDIGVDQNLNSFVGAVGENEILGIDAEEFTQFALDVAVFGIDGEPFGGEMFAQELDDAG